MMLAEQASLYFHTLRHLKPVQIYGRLLFRIPHRRPRSTGLPLLRQQTAPFTPPASRRPSLLSSNCFSLLNETRDLDRYGWDDPKLPKLWRYNLHYFDDLNTRNAASRTEWHSALIRRWIAENPATRGTGWEPYPCSLRIVNWIKWSLAGNALTSEACESLAIQVRWLARRMEHHLGGNHLLANAKALAFAGCFFDGDEAQCWLTKGSKILRRELHHQIFGDGGHFELSPMYHALVLEDVLDLLNLARSYGLASDLARDCEAALPRMRAWLAALVHPDGEIGFFNDAAFGIAPSPAELEAYAERLGFAAIAVPETTTHLRETGYLRLARGPFTAFLDAARVGPDHLPGHAHADTLSFELSVGKQRVIVNGGTGEYGLSAERQRQRSTAAHNTLCVENRDSSEVWAGFRVARRARPHGISVEAAKDHATVRASHDGYHRLSGRPIHSRCWGMTESSFTVQDELSGPVRQASARFHFHPAIEVRMAGRTLHLIHGGETLLRGHVETGTPGIEASTWHSEFGLSQPNTSLAVACDNNRAALRFEC